jgi:hypothetical protein
MIFLECDEDPEASPPSILNKYTVAKTKGSIKLLNNKKRSLIQISPRLEEWLLKRAKINKINPAEFKLPNDPNKLHKIPHIEKNKNYQEFLRKLIAVDIEIQTLKKWIDETLK